MKKSCQDNKTREATERQTPAVVLLDYVINFGLSVTDGFNTYTRDQGGRVLFNSSLSKNGPLYDLSKELYVNNLKLNYMMLLELWQITKVVGKDKLQHTVQQSSLSRFYHHFFFLNGGKKKLQRNGEYV